jgi:hypothetical protein
MTMNPQSDNLLGQSLKEWRVATPLPAGFERAVWRRIALAEAQPAGVLETWRGWLEQAFARQSVAVGYVALVVTVALLAGYERGQAAQRSWSHELAARYAQSVDPDLNPAPK